MLCCTSLYTKENFLLKKKIKMPPKVKIFKNTVLGVFVGAEKVVSAYSPLHCENSLPLQLCSVDSVGSLLRNCSKFIFLNFCLGSILFHLTAFYLILLVYISYFAMFFYILVFWCEASIKCTLLTKNAWTPNNNYDVLSFLFLFFFRRGLSVSHYHDYLENL